MIRGIGFRLQLSSSAAAIFPLKCKTNILSGKGFEARKKIEDKDSLESEREKTWSAQCVWVRDRERERKGFVCANTIWRKFNSHMLHLVTRIKLEELK